MSIRILIVDDEAAIPEILDEYLRRVLDDYTVISANCGSEAIKKVEDLLIKDLPPDITIMDWRMPEMDGLECTRLLKELGVENVHILTAYLDPELIAEASNAGVRGILKKSEGFHRVAEKIAEMVRASHSV